MIGTQLKFVLHLALLPNSVLHKALVLACTKKDSVQRVLRKFGDFVLSLNVLEK